MLGCKAAVTLLDIVNEHQIVFDYQEVAIIQKFNKALQNLEVFEQHELTTTTHHHNASQTAALQLREKELEESAQSLRHGSEEHRLSIRGGEVELQLENYDVAREGLDALEEMSEKEELISNESNTAGGKVPSK